MAANGRGSWRGKVGFILAAAGSAVGLGNLWKFPYLTYKHGGGIHGKGAGTFVLAYLISVVVIGLPAMLAEIIIGKRSKRNAVGAFKVLAPGTPWKLVGALGVVTGFVLLSYYGVVAGWTAKYLIASLSGQLTAGSVAELGGKTTALFNDFLASPGQQILWLFIFLAMTVGVVAAGVASGIERCTKILMPVLFGILVLLAVRVLMLDNAQAAISYLFVVDLSQLDRTTILEAMGQAFFSLSLGMGAIITYGSYLSEKESVLSSAVAITMLDTIVALLAAVVVFGVIFHLNIQMPGGGIGNLFTALPAIFGELPGGNYLLTLFYLLVVFAALTSTISLLETVVAYFIDERGWTRRKAVLLVGVAEFIVGIPSALSFNLLKSYTLAGKTFFDWADYLCANWSLPIGGLLTTLFAGWVLHTEHKQAEFPSRFIASLWNFFVRFLTPAAIAIVLLGLVFGLTSSG